MIELLLLDATNAEERAGDRAEKTRIRLNDRLSVVVGSFALIGLLAVGVGAYLFWQDVSIKSFFVRIAGDSPLGQLIAPAIIGALSGIAGGLALVSPLERTSLVEPRRFRKLAMLKALFGAMAGVAFADP